MAIDSERLIADFRLPIGKEPMSGVNPQSEITCHLPLATSTKLVAFLPR
jgi:hypothetical protein